MITMATRCPNLFGAHCIHGETRNGFLCCMHDPAKPKLITDECPRQAQMKVPRLKNNYTREGDKNNKP